jgi:Putative adhesin
MRSAYPSSLICAAALSLAAVVLGGCAATTPRTETAAAGEPPPYTVERIKHDLPLPETVKHVRIHNPHGSVGLKQIDSRTLGAYEVVQLIGATPEKPLVEMKIEGDTALVTVSYASDKRLGTDKLVDGYRKGRVDLGMFLPTGPDLHVTTTYGDISIRRVSNEVTAHARDGKVMVAGFGSIDASTESGDLRVFPLSAKWLKPMKLKTRSGNILMEVPLYGEIALDAETGGSFGGQVELAMSQAGGERQHGRLSRGGGGQHIDIRSESGDVYLIPIHTPPQR